MQVRVRRKNPLIERKNTDEGEDNRTLGNLNERLTASTSTQPLPPLAH